MSGVVCVFAKPPRPGLVKTRLQPWLTPREAADLARACFEDTWRDVGALGARRIVATTDVGAFPDELAAGAPRWSQGGGDLGARQARVLRRVLDGGAPWALAVGTDSPGRPRRLLAEAVAALEAGADAVLGPADDGGFHLLGLRRCPSGLLDGLPWSRRETFADTLARLRSRGLTTCVVGRWFDLDRRADIHRLDRELRSGRVVAPATAAFFETSEAVRPPPGSVAVVVPVLNEARALPRQLEALRGLGLSDLVVADGGSDDGTVALVRACPWARLVEAPRGRGLQMNAGAEAARGAILLFLHADVRLPDGAIAEVRRALAAPEVGAGAFTTWTTDAGAGPIMRPLLHLADVRSRITRRPYGDQAVFVRASTFGALGGYPELPLMEDLAFADRLRRRATVTTVRRPVTVSGRRFVARPIYYTALVNVFPALWRAGVPARWLARLYGAVR